MAYYNPPWGPAYSESILEETKSYRNYFNGHLIHGNVNIAWVGGFAADNGRNFQFFQNDNLRFDDMDLRGYTPEYQNVIRETNSQRFCQSGFTFQMDKSGFYSWKLLEEREEKVGITANNLRFSHFGSDCSEGAMGMTRDLVIYTHLQHDSRDEISNITFDETTVTMPTINMCPVMDISSGTTIAIYDRDGSLHPAGGEPGFVVSREEKMIAFLPEDSCLEIPGDSCAYYCVNACLRHIKVTVNGAFSTRNIEMVVVREENDDAWKNTTVSWSRYLLHHHPPTNLYANTMVTREGTFGIALPEGNYTFSFRHVNTKVEAWPGYASLTYELPPRHCSGYVADDGITLQKPDYDVVRCGGELLENGSFDDIDNSLHMGRWQQENLDLELVQPGYDGTGYALRTTTQLDSSSSSNNNNNNNNNNNAYYLSQYLDTSCLQEEGYGLIEFRAHIRFERAGASNSQPMKCNPYDVYTCPSIRLVMTAPLLIVTVSDEHYNTDNGWYTVTGSLPANFLFEVNPYSVRDKVMLKIEHPSDKYHMILDDVSLSYTEYEMPSQAPSGPTISPMPTFIQTNLAFHKPTEQSSTLWPSENAVDGNIFSSTHTWNAGKNQINWWKVNLEMVAAIHRIRIVNRYDCCQERFNGAVVEILDFRGEPVAIQSVREDSPESVEFRFDQNNNAINIEASSIRISVYEQVLSLAEVEVYG
eukprot:CAMPEP_0178914652 /NCGR_PEP_ID=MMETSP0786-20121207/11554_1 /TAXON_ID=186022 /ORGANISM="Thalassionema frauenfeldii, Strain CCMP 1798" /LENGTH=700 /DNA_ID=CAMNT_0020587603 /DNA_START=475 /DNA_END=2573 /DNA_ORIENTATION=-